MDTLIDQYKCPSYFDEDGVLQDCFCGKCKASVTKEVTV